MSWVPAGYTFKCPSLSHAGSAVAVGEKRRREESLEGSDGTIAFPFPSPSAALQHISSELCAVCAAQAAVKSGETLIAAETKVRLLLEQCANLLIHCNIVATNPKTNVSTDFRIAEVEMYCNDGHVHPDTFAHGDVQQHEPGLWYFHKKGGSYKAGSFKGMDITFGNVGVAGGALIRSLISRGAYHPKPDAVAPEAILVEGPSLTVDALLEAVGASSIAALVAPEAVLRVDDPRLTLRFQQGFQHGVIYRAPRVGLVPRTEASLRFAGKFYRFFPTMREQLSKLRAGIVAAFIVDGMSDVRQHSSATPANIQKIKSILGEAKSTNDPSAVLGADVTKTEVISFIVGYCAGKGFV